VKKLGVLGWCIGLLCLAGTSPAVAQARKEWKVFNGASFKVEYPPEFAARPSLKNPTFPDFYTSAFFSSPDGAAEFYVYSFGGEGQATDIALDPKKEVVASQSEKDVKKPTKKIRWVTIKAKDGSYTRSCEDTEFKDSGRQVFGIKYRDQKAYEKYKADYLRFKKSYAIVSNIGE
jgi:hypothetical protein